MYCWRQRALLEAASFHLVVTYNIDTSINLADGSIVSNYVLVSTYFAISYIGENEIEIDTLSGVNVGGYRTSVFEV